MDTNNNNNVIVSPTNINMISSPRSKHRTIQQIQKYHNNNTYVVSPVKRKATIINTITTSPITPIISIEKRQSQHQVVVQHRVVWYHPYHHYHHHHLIINNNMNNK